MRVIFTGDPVEIERGEGLSRVSTSLYGVHFPMSAEVDVSHLSDVQKRKLLNHPHFRAAGVDAAPVTSLIIPASAAAPAAMEAASDEATNEDAPAAKRAKAAKG